MDRLQRLLQFLESNPNDSFIIFALAKEYEGSGEMEKALTHYLQLVENDPEYIGAYYHLGKLQEQQVTAETAFKTYTEGMRIAKKIGDQHAYSELAGARLILGDEEDFE